MKMTRLLSGAALLAILAGCGGGDGGGDPQPQPVAAPQAATLLFPDNNSTCLEGEVLSPTQSRVTFQWSESQNTDSYQVVVRNLNTNNELTQNANTNQATLTLARGTPFQWNVVSKATGTSQTATSATWRFYNEGPGIANYAPFPAEAVFPARGAHLDATSSLTLSWAGADVDDDIASYEVFLGTAPGAEASAGTVTTATLEVAVSSGQAYYWRVSTHDAAGNSSESELFEFFVD